MPRRTVLAAVLSLLLAAPLSAVPLLGLAQVDSTPVLEVPTVDGVNIELLGGHVLPPGPKPKRVTQA